MTNELSSAAAVGTGLAAGVDVVAGKLDVARPAACAAGVPVSALCTRDSCTTTIASTGSSLLMVLLACGALFLGRAAGVPLPVTVLPACSSVIGIMFLLEYRLTYSFLLVSSYNLSKIFQVLFVNSSAIVRDIITHMYVHPGRFCANNNF